MTRKLQILRGTTAQNNAYTGAVGELTMDTDRNEVRIHDGQTVGGIKIGDRNMPILTSMFFDHITNDMSWLRADTFSWQSGDVYKAAYEHLADEHKGLSVVASGDILGEEKTYYRDSSKDTVTNFIPLYAWVANDGTITYTRVLAPSVGSSAFGATGNPEGTITESTAKSDTIGDITIAYCQADDGHKICTPDQESNIAALYAKTGAADYYLLDTTNKQFKLPRKHAEEGLIEYYYVGNFSQEAVEQTAGLNTELFNGKADVDLSNMNASQSAKETIAGWGIPDYSAGIDILSSITSGYQAPGKGVVCFFTMTATSATNITVNNNLVLNKTQTSGNYSTSMFVPLEKNDVIKSTAVSGGSVMFFPLKGVN